MVAILPIVFYLSVSPLCNSKTSKIKQKNICLNSKVFLFILLLIMALLSIIFKNHSLLYLPPILISLSILFPFALSLSSGYIPLITQFYYLSEGLNLNDGLVTAIDPKRVQYTHILTWLWVIIISMMLLEIILLSLFAPLEIWSLFTNFINYFFLLLFMIFEWLFRNFYFKQWESPLTFIRQLIVIDHRQLLKKHP